MRSPRCSAPGYRDISYRKTMSACPPQPSIGSSSWLLQRQTTRCSGCTSRHRSCAEYNFLAGIIKRVRPRAPYLFDMRREPPAPRRREDDGNLWLWHLQFDRLLVRVGPYVRHLSGALDHCRGPRSSSLAMDRLFELCRRLDRRRMDRRPGVVGNRNTPAGSDQADRQHCTRDRSARSRVNPGTRRASARQFRQTGRPVRSSSPQGIFSLDGNPMFKHIAVATTVAVSLPAYAAHSWRPGPGQTAEGVQRYPGQCKLVADIGNSADGFIVASGRPQYVGGALHHGRTTRNHRAWMMARAPKLPLIAQNKPGLSRTDLIQNGQALRCPDRIGYPYRSQS